MSFLQILRAKLRNIRAIREFIAFTLTPSGLFDKRVLNMAISPEWKHRIWLVQQSKDNQVFSKHSKAGQVEKGKQYTHNGLRVNLGSYYGPEIAQLLYANQGVHEPQEERVFAEVLKHMSEGATMVELGSFWAFYSMWFHAEVPGAKNYMIEPSAFNIKCGKKNFSLNNMEGCFYHAYIGGEDKLMEDGVEMVSISGFAHKMGLDHIDLLHSDIQGFEYEMLQGSGDLFSKRKVDYVFISTHTEALHRQCYEFLKNQGYAIIAEHNLSESFSVDGLIAAVSPLKEAFTVPIDKYRG